MRRTFSGRVDQATYDPADSEQVAQVRLWDAIEALTASIQAGYAAGATGYVQAAGKLLAELHDAEGLL